MSEKPGGVTGEDRKLWRRWAELGDFVGPRRVTADEVIPCLLDALEAVERERDAAREALDHLLGGYEDLIYLTGKGYDLDECDHPLRYERKDSRVDEAAEEARAALAQEGADGN